MVEFSHRWDDHKMGTSFCVAALFLERHRNKDSISSSISSLLSIQLHLSKFTSWTYSPSPVYIVIVIVALAEELPLLVTLLATSLLGMLVSATEMPISLKLNRTNPTRRIARVTTMTSLFTSTSSQFNYSLE
jgi:hypothetical protein